MRLRNIRAVFVLSAFLAFVAPTLGASGAKIPDHVYVIVLENHSFDAALNSGLSPFLHTLAGDHGVAACYFAVTHPSLPNYLAMIGGDDFDVRDDAPSCFASDLRSGRACHRFEGDSLVDQLEAAGLGWALYAQTLPAADVLRQSSGPDALYVQKHNPFAYFAQIAADPARLAKFKPFSSFAADLAAGMPNFVYIVPNQCDDGHGAGGCLDPSALVRDYDAFVEKTVGMIRASEGWTKNSAIIVTFDEGGSPSASDPALVERCGGVPDGGAARVDNHIATIVVTECGGRAVETRSMNHYALLATIEDAFRLPRLRKAARAPTLADMLDRPCPPESGETKDARR